MVTIEHIDVKVDVIYAKPIDFLSDLLKITNDLIRIMLELRIEQSK